MIHLKKENAREENIKERKLKTASLVEDAKNAGDRKSHCRRKSQSRLETAPAM